MIETLIYFVVVLLILGLLCWLLIYISTALPLPPPFPMAIRILVTVIAVLVVCYMLLSLIGAAPPLRKL